ncbi:Protein of unknown function [Pyronema omphalodes CBS 100304]|uniref:Uncharacterized protein n=1 Tax=Pyronema omphalodes (strain CBS 100304) TaxID=1076935 RepID=U4LLA9_PYROM|nr:Protein of unknown function [Pyronema omphalodes CBS 100304]
MIPQKSMQLYLLK